MAGPETVAVQEIRGGGGGGGECEGAASGAFGRARPVTDRACSTRRQRTPAAGHSPPSPLSAALAASGQPRGTWSAVIGRGVCWGR